MRFVRPASTRPGPHSTTWVMPSAAIFVIVSDQRTGLAAWRASVARIVSGSKLVETSTLWMTAIFGIACGVGQGGIVLVGFVFALGVLVCGSFVEHAMARWLNRGDNSDQGDTYHTR